MISRELRRTVKFYESCLSWFIYHMVILREVVEKLHCMYSFSFSKDYCQAHGCFSPDEVMGQDRGEPHGCYLKISIFLVDLFFFKELNPSYICNIS